MQNTKRKSLIQKWAPVLESEIGKPIRNSADASVIATMLENQVKLNKGFLQESANVTSDVQVYQQYALPLIRRQFPELLAMNTVAVIPTTTPQGIYFALRYLYDGSLKSNQFRTGEKMEIGFDLDKNHTGDAYHGGGKGTPWTTAEGELLSNYMENSSALATFDVDGAVGGYRIKTASIKVIKGSVIVGTRAIKSHYTLELQQDLAAVHGQDIEALLLEALQFEIQQEIDREILAALVYVATTTGLGGEAKLTVDLALTNMAARWAAERIAGGIVNTVLATSQKIAVVSRMGSGNFAICSPDVIAAMSTLNNGIYIPTYLNTNINQVQGGGVVETGTLVGGSIKVYRDIYAEESYALVGYKGPRQGESGIIFMPYIPYIFTKTAGQDDGSPRLIVKSRYAIVANLLGAGQFYRYVKFSNIAYAILGINSNATTSSDSYPWEVKGATYDDEALGGVGAGEGDTSV